MPRAKSTVNPGQVPRAKSPKLSYGKCPVNHNNYVLRTSNDCVTVVPL